MGSQPTSINYCSLLLYRSMWFLKASFEAHITLTIKATSSSSREFRKCLAFLSSRQVLHPPLSSKVLPPFATPNKPLKISWVLRFHHMFSHVLTSRWDLEVAWLGSPTHSAPRRVWNDHFATLTVPILFLKEFFFPSGTTLFLMSQLPSPNLNHVFAADVIRWTKKVYSTKCNFVLWCPQHKIDCHLLGLIEWMEMCIQTRMTMCGWKASNVAHVWTSRFKLMCSFSDDLCFLSQAARPVLC